MIRLEATYFSTSKTKTIGLILGSICLIAGGICMILFPVNDPVKLIHKNRVLMIIIGLVNIIISGIGLIFFIAQLFGYSIKENKIKIDKIGITDKYHLGSFGHIPWTDILETKISTINNQKYLTIIVDNPMYYIDKQRDLSSRQIMKDYYKLTGSPINISSNFFSLGVNKLKMKIDAKFIEYKKGSR